GISGPGPGLDVLDELQPAAGGRVSLVEERLEAVRDQVAGVPEILPAPSQSPLESGCLKRGRARLLPEISAVQDRRLPEQEQGDRRSQRNHPDGTDRGLDS